MRGRRRTTLVLLGAALIAPAPAARAGDDPDPHGDPGTVVAAPFGTEYGDPRLYVRQSEGEVCVSIELSDYGGGGGGCSDLPERDLFEPFLLHLSDPDVTPPSDGKGRFTGGAARAVVHAVEVVLTGRRTVRLPTFPAPAELAGTPAGELRYFFGRLPRGARVRGHRMLAEDGALLAEEEEDLEDGSPGGFPPARVLDHRRGTRRLSITATIERGLVPIRGDIEHRERFVCFRVRELRDGSDDGGGGWCMEDAPREPEIDLHFGCGRRGRHAVYGLSPTADVPTAAVLTDGRRIRVRKVTLPPSFRLGHVVAFVAHAPRGAGVRELDAPDGRIPVGAAPTVLVGCATFAVTLGSRPPTPAPPAPGGDAVLDGSPRLFVRDEGDDLCLAIERPTHADDCGYVGPWLGDATVTSSDDQRLVAGAVDPRIRAVRIHQTGGRTFDVPTHAGEAYRGRLAGQLAFFSAAAEADRTIIEIEILDENGQPLRDVGNLDPALAAPLRKLQEARGADGPFTLAVGPLESKAGEVRASCLVGYRGPLPEGPPECFDHIPPPWVLLGAVGCTPRAAVLVVGLRRGGRARAILADGRSLAFTRHRAPTGERFGMLVLPPGAALRRVEISDGTRLTIPAPPAVRQCGYGLVEFFLR